MEHIFIELERRGIRFPDNRTIDQLLSHIVEVINNIRLWANYIKHKGGISVAVPPVIYRMTGGTFLLDDYIQNIPREVSLHFIQY
jgi:hypothetical protein